MFKLESSYKPTGDQPQAIQSLVDGLNAGANAQVLLGVTGSGKTFTVANVIAQVNRPTLIMSHNKTLAAQLYSEMKAFFPHNAVEYFVSYYDYYQPEAYIPSTDLYIEKDLSINEEIDRLRLSAVAALLSGRKDVIIVSSVSCIYGLGSPQDFTANVIKLKRGAQMPMDTLLKQLVGAQYVRNDIELARGRFRVKGDTIDIALAYADYLVRIEFFGNEIDAILTVDPISGQVLEEFDEYNLSPATIFLTSPERIAAAKEQIKADLAKQIEYFISIGEELYAKRIEERVKYDLEMLDELGYCSGVENYSRYFDGRKEGTPPYCLLDYFPKDMLLVIDESHVTVPQIRGMYGGDKSRKDNLVTYGFRLPAARDNRPLKFDEFEQKTGQTIYVSATPDEYELEKSDGIVIDQLIRPTGLLDPEIEVRPTENQVDDLMDEIKFRIHRNERCLVTTLTKRMAEELDEYLRKYRIKSAYIHSDIDTIERVKIMEDLRRGEYDVLVGVNLLREGLDLPEVSLVAILDADKTGFLRDQRSLTQTVGRAARHVHGKAVLYGDKITPAMQATINETNRRRAIQMRYNEEHGITPTAIIKTRTAIIGQDTDMRHPSTPSRHNQGIMPSAPASNMRYTEEFDSSAGIAADPVVAYMSGKDMQAAIDRLKTQMIEAAKRMDFLEAAQYRDEILKLEEMLKEKEG